MQKNGLLTFFSDEFGSRSPVIQKPFRTKSATSIVALVFFYVTVIGVSNTTCYRCGCYRFLCCGWCFRFASTYVTSAAISIIAAAFYRQ